VPSELIAVVEIESVSRKDHPWLEAAIELCKKEKETLNISKLDRLARDVAFISTRMDSGIAMASFLGMKSTRFGLGTL